MSDCTEIMLRDDQNRAVAFTANAHEVKEQALCASALIGKVTNANENATAVAAQTELQRILKLAEDARVAVKEPVLKFGKLIDETAREFKKAIEEEILRVARLIGDFQTLELAKQRSAEAARRDDLDNIERERHLALSQAPTHEQYDAIRSHFDDKALAAQEVPIAAPAKVDGQVVKQDWSITVHTPLALANAHPGCVNITPRLSEIKALLNAGVASLPGVTATRVIKSGVRLKSQPKAIDV